tara:strand:- start:845 stop:1021 length:177 start_codon:yes stop_codon:yes gene_type:complete
MDKLTAQIKIKASPCDKARWKLAIETDGRNMSDVFRAYMNRYAARIERNGAKASKEGG